MKESTSGITTLLHKVAGGDDECRSDLFRRVEKALRAIAQKELQGEPADPALQPTVLVDDTFLRIIHAGSKIKWRDRRHFYRVAGKTMRRILVEYARERKRQKRGAGRRPERRNDLSQFPAPDTPDDILALDEALEKLARRDPRAAEVVELRFLWNFTIQETAKIIGRSDRTVKKDWNSARSFLLGELTDDDDTRTVAAGA